MLSLSLTVPLTITIFVALFINAIVLLMVILCKQVSPSNILLLHLSAVEALLCIVFLIFTTPLIFRHGELVALQAICSFNGFLMTLLHPIALWTVCGLNCDRFYAIAAPLHYNAIVNPKKVVCGLACGWFVGILCAIPPLFDIAPYRLDPNIGVCIPSFYGPRSLWFSIAFTTFTLIVPGSFIILCNIKVFLIARYHRHRIAAAIFEVTLSAQVTITHQRNPFPLPFEAIPPKLRSRSPLSTVFQIVGSFLLLYCPYYAQVMWNSTTAAMNNGVIPLRLELPCSVAVIPATLIQLSVLVNAIIYGIKSKVMRKAVQNYWRKKKTKNEISNEIQARTPSTCGSRRPSLNALAIFQRPLSQRRLSETFIDINQATNENRPRMKRIASEMSWRPLTLQFDGSPTEPMPYSSSTNTLRIPGNDSDENSAVSSEREQLKHLRNSIQSSMRSYQRKSIAMPSMPTSSSRSSLNVASVFLQKVFRIDFDNYKRNHRTHEPLSPLRSPQILITSVQSDDSDQTMQSSPVRINEVKQQSLTSLFEKRGSTTIRYEKGDKLNESDTESIFSPDLNSSQADMTSLSKRCFSLDEQSKFESNGIASTEEQLLLSWPTTRKKYKLLKEYEPNVNPLYSDRCEEPEVIL